MDVSARCSAACAALANFLEDNGFWKRTPAPTPKARFSFVPDLPMDRVRLSAIADGEVQDIGSVAFTFRDTDLGVEVDATVSVPGVSADAGAAVAEVVRLLTDIKDSRPAPSEERPDW